MIINKKTEDDGVIMMSIKSGEKETAPDKEKEASDKDHVTILAIESSCDETAAAVVRDGREVLSNIISSQIALHTVYGGVVPEYESFCVENTP